MSAGFGVPNDGGGFAFKVDPDGNTTIGDEQSDALQITGSASLTGSLEVKGKIGVSESPVTPTALLHISQSADSGGDTSLFRVDAYTQTNPAIDIKDNGTEAYVGINTSAATNALTVDAHSVGALAIRATNGHVGTTQDNLGLKIGTAAKTLVHDGVDFLLDDSIKITGTTAITGTLMVTNPGDTSDFYVFPSGEGAANSVLTATGANALQFSSPDLLITQVMVVAVTEENTNIQTGTSQVTVRAPFAAMITAIRGSLSTASSSGAVEFDINIGGGSIFSTRPTIDANEKTTTTAATAAVFANNPTPMSDDAEITFDIDSAGTGARGLKVAIYYVRSS